MKLSLIHRGRVAVVALSAALGSSIVVACAATTPDAAPEPAPDGGAATPPEASTPSDASAEATVDVVVPPRECSDDGFCPTALPASQTLRGVWGDGTGIVWSVSEEGHVLRWDGTTWKIHASGLGALTAIWGSGPTDLWIGGEEGLRHGTGATSATLTFEKVASPGATVSVTSIWGSGPSDVWATGSTVEAQSVGRVLRYGPAGDAGIALQIDPVSNQPRATAFDRVWGSAATGVWVSGVRLMAGEDFFEEVAVFRRAAGGSRFIEVPLPADPQEALIFGVLAMMGGAAISGDDTVLILGRSASSVPGVWRGTTTNGGQTFSFTYTKAGRNDEPAINAVWGVSSAHAWAVGDYGRVHRWNGATWKQAAVTLTKYPLTAPLHAVWSSGPEDVWVVGKDIALHRDPSKHP